MKKRKRPKRPTRAPKKAAPRVRTRAKPLRIVDAINRGAGRPTQYVAQYAHIAEVMCKSGATDFELGQAFGVSESTINNWKARHPEFLESIKGAKQLPIERVERSLYHRAIGYSHEATKILQNGSEVVAVQYVEHYPPDTPAARLWLLNSDPLRWRDRHEVAAEIHDKRGERELTDQEIDDRLERARLRRAKVAELVAAGVTDPKQLALAAGDVDADPAAK